MDDIATLLSHQLQVQRQKKETWAEMLSQLFEVRLSNSKQFEIINKNLKRIAMQLVLRPSSLIPGRRRQRLQEEQQSETEVIERRMPARLFLTSGMSTSLV